MVVIGITGGVGTGKSTVARMFQQLGAAILDADVIAHQAMEPKRLAWREIVRAFGEGMVNEDETINRRKLARLVFCDEASRRRLERILHPRVLREIKRRLHRLRRSKRVRAVVLDVPLLIEAGAQGVADALVVVTAPPEVQRARLAAQHGWSDEEIQARINSQSELSAKAALADEVIDNSNGVEFTRTQVKRIWNRRVAHSSNRSSSTSRR